MATPIPGQKANKHGRYKSVYDRSEVRLTRGGPLRGPTLTKATGIPAAEWSAPVKIWWETWRRSPQAEIFEGTDWQSLATIAPLVQKYWDNPTTNAAAEIRHTEANLGATHMDRLRARMKIVDEPSGTYTPTAGTGTGPGTVTPITKKRSLAERMADGHDGRAASADE